MLSCTGKRSHRHTILHVSFSNSFGLASARPTPQGLSGAPIYRIATNEALRCLSKRQEETVSLESETTGVTLIADNSLEEADKLAAKLQRAILTLSPKQQLAFNLRYYDELCFSEIARVADSTPTSIRQSYHVAKEKIIKYMNQND